MLQQSVVEALRERFLAAGFLLDEVSDRLGAAGLAGLARNSTMPASRALAGATDAQASLIRLFLLQQAVPRDTAAAALGDLARFAPLLRAGADQVHGAIEIRPYAFDRPDGTDVVAGWVCSDLTPSLDGVLTAPRADFVLGASPASTTLAQLTTRRPIGSALDLGTGCGIQSLHLATHAARTVATDLNPRACAMARLTAGLNGIALDVREGSLYEPVAGERFDLIVTNPPYVMSPPQGSRLIYREGSMQADDLVRAVVTGAAERLNPGGSLQVLGNWAITDQPWQERLAAWIEPTGCDALVLQREQLDAYEYIEIWLADAGLVGTPEYAARYAEWVDYFEALGIIGAGMGWITLYRNDRERPEVRFEDWPHQVHQPVGDAFAEFPDGVSAATLPDADLLARTWTLAPDVASEALGRPGAEDPEHLVLRRSTGFGRAVEVDTGLAAVVGACDGELPLDALVDAVAGLLEVDPGALAADLLPRLRRLLEQGFLR